MKRLNGIIKIIQKKEGKKKRKQEMRRIENKLQDARYKTKHINICIICKWSKHPN